jgi:hypothetical protein
MANKEPKPWDRRPWPTKGDATLEVVFEAVGRALSRWEAYDGYLAVLFSAFISPKFETRAAMRAYSAVRTFEGRLEMLRASSEAYFDKMPDPDFLARFKDILRHASCYTQRRNEITHATAGVFRHPDNTQGDGFGLCPAYASFKERNLENIPTYCMTSAEIEYFSNIFLGLQEPVQQLITAMVRKPYEKS